MALHLTVPSISSLAVEVQRRVGALRDSLAQHCLHAGAESPSTTLSTVRLLLDMASSYMDGRLQDQLDQILRIASAYSDEILQDAFDWTLSIDDDLRSMVLKVIDCLESRSAQVPSSRSPPSLSPPPQSSPTSPTQATTGPSSSPLLPDSLSSSPSRFCQDNLKPPGVTPQPMCDGGLDGSHIRGPGGVGVDTFLRHGDRGWGAALQLLHHPHLGNHHQAGGGGTCREVSQTCSHKNIISEKEDLFKPRTQDVKSKDALLHEAPEAQPPPRILRTTSSESILPHRRHLMPALVHTFSRRPTRAQRPRLLRSLPCTPYTMIKICKRGKKMKPLSTSCIKLTNTVKLRHTRWRALTRAGILCCRRLHGPQLQPAPPRDPYCSQLSSCTHHRPRASLSSPKPVHQSQARTPPRHHLGNHVLSSNEIRLNQFTAFHRDDDSRLSQPSKWPYAPLSSRPFPPDPGVSRRCRTSSWPLSPSHPGLPHAGHLHLPHDPGGLHDPAPDDLVPCRDLPHDVLVLHSLHHEAHDVPHHVQASPRVPSVAVHLALHRGLTNDDLSHGNSHAAPTCLASPGRASDPMAAAILENPTSEAYDAQPKPRGNHSKTSSQRKNIASESNLVSSS